MIKQVLNFAFLFTLVVAGFIYPLLPQNNIEYIFAGTGSVISVSKETQLIFRSDRAFGLKLNGETIKKVALEEETYFYVTLKPEQKMEITGSPFNQNVYVAYADPHIEEKVISVTVEKNAWAHAMAHPSLPAAIVVLIFGLIFVLPVKADGVWLNLWLAWRFKKADAEKHGEGMSKAGAAYITAVCQGFSKNVEVIAMPMAMWTAYCISFLAYAVLVSVLRLIFTGF